MKLFGIAVCILFLFTSCDQQVKTSANKLPTFHETNMVVGGELQQALVLTNGVTFYFTPSNAVIWFSEGSDIVVGFDPENLRPRTILVDVTATNGQPDQSVFDLNADGVPDIRHTGPKGDQRKELFYHGEWYGRKKAGTNTAIIIEGIETKVRFDGRRWIELKD